MIYLDNAATSRPKPPEVCRAVYDAMLRMASPGRGGYKESLLASEVVYACREKAAAMFFMDKPENVIFTHNATHALNIAIKALACPGGRIVMSGYEHNAVWRPAHAVPGARVVIAGTGPYSRESVFSAYERTIRPGTCLVVCNYVSNVFGCILPVEEICALCRARNVPCVVDASQAAGVLDVDMRKIGADAVCMPGHKGLLGPQGTGIMLVGSPRVKRTLYEGGTGNETESPRQPLGLPERFESGTPNVPGIAGLLAGMRIVEAIGPANILDHERSLRRLLEKKLEGCGDIECFTCDRAEDQTGVLSLRVRGEDCESVALKLGNMGFAVRTGLHCASMAHRTAGTLETGTLRVSPGIYTTPADILLFAEALLRLRSKKNHAFFSPFEN